MIIQQTSNYRNKNLDILLLKIASFPSNVYFVEIKNFYLTLPIKIVNVKRNNM